MRGFFTITLGQRVYVFLDGRTGPRGWMSPEGITLRRNRTGVFSRPSDWTGRWVVHHRGEAVGTVGTAAEGLLMVARLEELG